MNDLENSKLQVSRYIVSQNSANKNETGETSNEAPTVDKNCVYKLSKKLIRIEYPGLVKNVSKAIETLGGMHNIETAIVDSRKKMEIRFHPDNKYNKPCTSDHDSNPGLLIKVMKKDEEYDYDIIGFVSDNFKFNKAADFQYLPFTQDDTTGDVEYVYNKIIPEKLPDLEFLVSKESATQPVLLVPYNFSRYDTSHHTLYLKAGEKFNLDNHTRPELFKMFDKKPKGKYQYRQISHIVSITDPHLEIPAEAKELAVKVVREKDLEDSCKEVKKLFEERPIWLKAAVQHITGITAEMSKALLPANGYFWSTGPWRMTWTRFGYDPRANFSNRIYQTLDFRIRESEGTKIIIRTKRGQSTSRATPRATSEKIHENRYILSPDCIPPARQMFYQFCDIRIPEIQDMVQRLPKGLGTQKFDVKNGWLPANFSEQCREIASRYVLEKVHRELVADSIRAQSQQQEKETDEDEDDNPLSYSSRMLNVMKKGFRRSIDTAHNEEEIGTVVLSDDDSDEDMEQGDIPERLEEDDEERLSDNSEMELDMEAVEEINQLISETKKESKQIQAKF